MKKVIITLPYILIVALIFLSASNSAATPVGFVEEITEEAVSGWVYDPANPSRAVDIRIYINNDFFGSVIAGQPSNNYTDRCQNCGFTFDLPPLAQGRHDITVFAAPEEPGEPHIILFDNIHTVYDPVTGILHIPIIRSENETILGPIPYYYTADLQYNEGVMYLLKLETIVPRYSTVQSHYNPATRIVEVPYAEIIEYGTLKLTSTFYELRMKYLEEGLIIEKLEETASLNNLPEIYDIGVPAEIIAGQEFEISYKYDDVDGLKDILAHHIVLSDGTHYYVKSDGSGEFRTKNLFFSSAGYHWIDLYVVDSKGNRSNVSRTYVLVTGPPEGTSRFTISGEIRTAPCSYVCGNCCTGYVLVGENGKLLTINQSDTDLSGVYDDGKLHVFTGYLETGSGQCEFDVCTFFHIIEFSQ